jgi:transcriptional regulator with XRE-family HTH domain
MTPVPENEASDRIDRMLSEIGPRLKRVRLERQVTLTELAAATGISISTLSRLESGHRRANLELLLPISAALRAPLDDIIGTVPIADPRVITTPIKRDGVAFLPLTRQPGGPQTYQISYPARRRRPETASHEGSEWLYVVSGTLRLVLADQDLSLDAGEAAEFDSALPHWFGSAGQGPVELLAQFGRQGERVHVRATGRRTGR